MSDDNPPTITPSSDVANRSDLRELEWTRTWFEAAPREVLKTGEADKADLWRVEREGRIAVIKDFRDKAWWVRWLGRLQIRREVRAYRRLGGVFGVPALYGRLDAHALAMEWIDGTQLGRSRDRAQDGVDRLRQFRRILDEIHSRGVVHWDLRARENVLLDREGKVWVLDFASAMRLRPGGWLHRLLFRRLKLIDESAYLKWKWMLQAGPYTDDEKRFVERHRFWRNLWLHRRGNVGRGKKGQP